MKSRLAPLLFLACAGCAGTVPGQAPGFTPEARARIVAGQTTADDVRRIFGEPSQKLWLRAEQREAWGYRYRGDYEPREFWIELAADGRVHATSDGPDFAAGRYRFGGQ